MNMTRNSAKPQIQQIAAAVIGNALEWYDFAVFATMAVIIAKVFFPDTSEITGLLLTLATFGVGFVTRPLGGILIAMHSDRKGRRSALQLIIGMMTGALLIMVFTPSYHSIGLMAPVLIVFARLLQGLAAGGEFATATAYLVEAAPPNRKGLYGAWQMFGQILTSLGGALTGYLLTSTFSEQQLVDGMWRIPFVIGLAIAPLGWWIRQHLEEPEESLRARKTSSKVSLTEIIRRHPRAITANLSMTMCVTASIYILNVYIPTFLNRQFHVNLYDAYFAQTIGLTANLIAIPLSGMLSDRYGRKLVLLAFLVPYVVLLYPLFAWVQSAPTLVNLAVAYSILSSLLGGFLGPFTTASAEQFPSTVRSTGLALCYNLAVMIFGGFAQFIVTWLINSTGVVMMPVFYVLACSFAGLAGVMLLTPRRSQGEVERDLSSSPA